LVTNNIVYQISVYQVVQRTFNRLNIQAYGHRNMEQEHE